MRFAARSGFALLVAVAIFAACDRTPTDPALADPAAALLAGLTENTVYAASPTSLHSLFGVAVRRIVQNQRTAAIARLLDNWQRLNDEARSALRAGDRQAAQTKVAAVRAEEIRTVLRALGSGTAQRVVTEVGVGLARVRVDLALLENTGTDISRPKQSALQVSDMLQKANRALENRDNATALDYGTQASDLLDGEMHGMIALRRIPALESLFAEATERHEREQGAASVRDLLAPFDRTNQEARVALRAGDRVVATEKLEAARQEQIRVVLAVLGPNVVNALMQKVAIGIDSTRLRLQSVADPTLADNARKMLAEAQSLNNRARTAWSAREPGTALDLASHSAGLVNALQHLAPATKY